MSDAVNVAIVGCGMFGAEIAVKARQYGLSVAVYEADNDILNGASRNNQNRLHLGFHYPRDLETGRQSIRGFNAFKSKYAECIESDFPNAYFVAQEGSLTSVDEYMEFCKHLGAPYTKFTLEGFPINVENADPTVICDETVYDCEILRRLVWSEIRDIGIDVSLNQKVERIQRVGKRFELLSAGGPALLADVVINASYANINYLTEQLGFESPERQFEYTVVPIIHVGMPKVGVTIMDGSFMTVLPHGRTGNFLIYSVEKTVVAKDLSTQLDQRWLTPSTAPFSRIDKDRYFKETIEICRKFVPALEDAELVGFLEGPRAVLARSEGTDARPSIIGNYDGNYFTVFSGKIDHCMWVADEIGAKLRLRFNL